MLFVYCNSDKYLKINVTVCVELFTDVMKSPTKYGKKSTHTISKFQINIASTPVLISKNIFAGKAPGRALTIKLKHMPLL